MISTPRFRLRPLTAADANERYSAWFKDETAVQYIKGARARHAVTDLRAYIEVRAEREDVLFLGIFTRDDGAHIGNIKYEPISIAERHAVMGILIGDRAWRGKGVAEEVILASASFLRSRHGIETIYLGVHKEHAAARKSYEKAGFRETVTAPFVFDPAITLAMARTTG